MPAYDTTHGTERHKLPRQTSHGRSRCAKSFACLACVCAIPNARIVHSAKVTLRGRSFE